MKQAEMKLKVTPEGVDEIDEKLDKLKQKGTSLFAQLPKDLQRDLMGARDAIGGATKDALLGAAKDMSGAISAPALSTFSGVLASANRFRKETAAMSVSSGRDFEKIGLRVRGVSEKIGEMPGVVRNWGREFKRSTGDMEGGLDVMEAYKDRALELDKPFEQTVEQASRLANAFGLKSKQQVSDFFGTMGAQAKAVGADVGLLGRQWDAVEERFSRVISMKGGGLSKMTGYTAAFAASSQNPEIAQAGQAYQMNELNSGWRVVQMRMRQKGLLKKGETLYDEKTGQLDPDKYIKAQVFMTKEKLKWYGGRKNMMDIEGTGNLEALPAIASGLNAMDIYNRVGGDLSKLKPEERKNLEKYTGLTNARDQKDAAKENKDEQVGRKFLEAQDAAVDKGGGVAGIAMNQAAGVFRAAVDRFGNMVGLLPKLLRGGGGGGGSPAGTAAGVVAGTSGGVLGKVVPLVGAALAGYEAGTWADEKFGASDWISEKFARLLAPGYAEGRDQGQDPKTAATANAEALANKTLTVRIAPGPPPGQGPVP